MAATGWAPAPLHTMLLQLRDLDVRNEENEASTREFLERTAELLADRTDLGDVIDGEHVASLNDLLDSMRDADTCDGGLVLLDLRPSAAMLAEANAREVCAHVQKMRKDAGLRKEDVVEVGYECAAPADGGAAALPATLAEQAEYIAGRIGRSLLPLAACPPRAVRLHTEVHDAFKVLAIGDGGAIAQRAEPLTLVLLRGCAFVDAAKLAALVPDAAARDDVVNYVHCRDLAAVRADVAASGGVLRVPLGGQTVELRHKVHLFLSSAEAKAAGALA